MNDFFSYIETVLSGKALLALPLCYLAGVLFSFTPCTLPMIPVILGIAGISGSTPRKQALFLSSVFVMGLVAANIMLGVLAALSGVFFGSLAKLFIVRVLFSLFFILLGLISMDVLPFNLNFRFNVNTRRFGVFGVFLLGFLCGIAVTACIFPVLGTILLFVADKKDVLFGAAALALFSFGTGSVYLLFILLGREAFSVFSGNMRLLSIIKKIIGLIIVFIGIGFFYQSWSLL